MIYSGLLDLRIAKLAIETDSSSFAVLDHEIAIEAYGGLRGAGSRSQRGCRVTFQLCGARDISTLLQRCFSLSNGADVCVRHLTET